MSSKLTKFIVESAHCNSWVGTLDTIHTAVLGIKEAAITYAVINNAVLHFK